MEIPGEGEVTLNQAMYRKDNRIRTEQTRMGRDGTGMYTQVTVRPGDEGCKENRVKCVMYDVQRCRWMYSAQGTDGTGYRPRGDRGQGTKGTTSMYILYSGKRKRTLVYIGGNVQNRIPGVVHPSISSISAISAIHNPSGRTFNNCEIVMGHGAR